MATIMMFVPAYGLQVSVATFESTLKMVAHLQAKGHGIAVSSQSSPEIAELRNLAVTHWFDGMKGSTHLLMVDADMGFPPELVVDMLAFNEPIVGAIYPKKMTTVEWAASGWGEDVNAGGRGQFMKVRGLGGGFLLIRRDAIQTMIDKMPELIDTDVGDPAQHPEGRILRVFDSCRNSVGHRLSEDLSFCYRWEHHCGGEVWGAGGHVMEHVGQHSFKGCYAVWAEEKARAKGLAAKAEAHLDAAVSGSPTAAELSVAAE